MSKSHLIPFMPAGAPGLQNPPAMLADAVGHVIGAVLQYAQTCEVEQTRREAILAARDVEIERLRVDRDVTAQALGEIFGQRARAMQVCEAVIAKGLADDNLAVLERGLAHYTHVVTSNPFVGLGDLRRVHAARPV